MVFIVRWNRSGAFKHRMALQQIYIARDETRNGSVRIFIRQFYLQIAPISVQCRKDRGFNMRIDAFFHAHCGVRVESGH